VLEFFVLSPHKYQRFQNWNSEPDEMWINFTYHPLRHASIQILMFVRDLTIFKTVCFAVESIDTFPAAVSDSDSIDWL